MDSRPPAPPISPLPEEPRAGVSVHDEDTTVLNVVPPPTPVEGRPPRTPWPMIALIAALLVGGLLWWLVAQSQRQTTVSVNATATTVAQATASTIAQATATADAAIASQQAASQQAAATSQVMTQATTAAQSASVATATAVAVNEVQAAAQTVAVQATAAAAQATAAAAQAAIPTPAPPPPATPVVIVVTATRPPAPPAAPAVVPAAPAPPPPAKPAVLVPAPPVRQPSEPSGQQAGQQPGQTGGQAAAPGATAAAPAASPVAPRPVTNSASVTTAEGEPTLLRYLGDRVRLSADPDALPPDLMLTVRPVEAGTVPQPPGPITSEIIFRLGVEPSDMAALPAPLALQVTYTAAGTQAGEQGRPVLGYFDGQRWAPVPNQSADVAANRVSADVTRTGVYALYRQP